MPASLQARFNQFTQFEYRNSHITEFAGQGPVSTRATLKYPLNLNIGYASDAAAIDLLSL